MTKAAKNGRAKKGLKLSGSVGMEEVKRDQAIKELGRKLINELNDRDITAKWMAAYLSELIVLSEENEELKAECRDLVLMLWRERRHYPGVDLMQRYTRALEAMELLLSAGEPVFHIWLPHQAPKLPDEDKVAIARNLKHLAGLLTSMVVRLAVEELGLEKEELTKIADIAEPDAETQFLKILRILVYDTEKREDDDDAGREILEAITELRDALDSLERGIGRKSGKGADLH